MTMKGRETVLSDRDRLRKWRRRDEETLRKVCLHYEEADNQDEFTDFFRDLDRLLLTWQAKQLQ